AEKAVFTGLHGGKEIRTPITLADLYGTGTPVILVGDNLGQLHGMKVSQGELTECAGYPVRQLEVATQPPLPVDVDGTGKEDLFYVSAVTITRIRGESGVKVSPSFSASTSIATPLTLITGAKGEKLAYFHDVSGAPYMLNLKTNTEILRSGLKFSGFGKPPVVAGSGPGGEGYLLIAHSSQPILRLVLSGIETDHEALQWPCYLGSALHSNRVDDGYRVRLAQQKKKTGIYVAAQLERAREAEKNGDWKELIEASRYILQINASQSEARAFYEKGRFRSRVIWIILRTIVLGALALFLSWRGFRFLVRKRDFRKANQLMAQGHPRESAKYFERLIRRTPGDAKAYQGLAVAYTVLEEYSPQSLPVFRRIYEKGVARPEDILGLARCYFATKQEDELTREIYERAMALADDVGWLKFALGRLYFREGKYEIALHSLRAAQKVGYQSADFDETLADTYLALGQRSAKTAPILEKLLASRRNDEGFLKALTDAYRDAKKVHPQALEVYRATLQKDPNYIPALLQLAQAGLHERRIDEVVSLVNRVLEFDPGNTESLWLLSNCYLIQNNTSESALQVYINTLQAYPDDKEILTQVARIYLASGRHDEEAYRLYCRALAENPMEPVLLKGLSPQAVAREDHPTTIRVLEALMELGQHAPDHYLQLAAAYAAKKVTDPKAERIYKEAIKRGSKEALYFLLLAEVFLKQSSTSAEAMRVYEYVYDGGDHRRDLGRQLARSFATNNAHEKTIKLCERLLKEDPEEDEIQRLFAQASMSNNLLDEAIREYERILSRDPHDHEALINVAVAYGKKNRLDPYAVECYKKGLQLEPDHTFLHLLMARFHASQQDYAATLGEYKTILKAHPKSLEEVLAEGEMLIEQNPEAPALRWFVVEVLIHLGRLTDAVENLQILFEQEPEKVSQALAAYDKVLAKDPNHINAHFEKGGLLKFQGNFELARAEFEAAYRFKPNSAETQHALQEIYELLLKESEDFETRFRLGCLYFQSGELDRAIACFQRTAQDYRWESESTKRLGKCFMSKGMLDLALQEFKKLVVDDEVKELLYRLAQEYEQKGDLVGAKTVYKQLFAADINYRNVRAKFEMLAGSTSDPMVFEKTAIINELSDAAKHRYELLDELGRGAMGIVYRARDKELDEIVALKILPDNLSNNPEAVRRFKLEARNARKLSHPNIVRIHDIGEEMGRKYISMELVEGTDLKRKIRTEGPLDPKTLVQFSRQIADAIAYAHSIGVVHRDIKPANIMLAKGEVVKITDFGIAKLVDTTTAEATLAGAVIGTPLYMAPEQIRGQPVDHRADIYSMGIMFYELATGRPPFTEGDLAYQHQHVDPKPLQYPLQEYADIVMKCIIKDREKRWQSAVEVGQALAQIKI
ncbi:MAG: tetratricopeptide repeat protein, partial [bacterium]